MYICVSEKKFDNGQLLTSVGHGRPTKARVLPEEQGSPNRVSARLLLQEQTHHRSEAGGARLPRSGREGSDEAIQQKLLREEQRPDQGTKKTETGIRSSEMSFEQIVVGIAMVLYAMVGVSYTIKGDMPWALVWFSYAMANVGLIWAAKN